MDGRTLTLDDGTLLEELGWVRRLAQRLLADPNDAEDLVQEAWLKARTTSAERFASRGRLRAWLAAVTRRMARDTQRARRRRAAREQRATLERARADVCDVLERSGLIETLLHEVRALDETLCRTVLLRYMDGYSTSEVAAATSVSEDLVRKRLSRARARLRARLEREGAWSPAAEPDVPEPAAAGGTVARGVALLGLVLGLALGIRALRTGGSPDPALAEHGAALGGGREPGADALEGPDPIHEPARSAPSPRSEPRGGASQASAEEPSPARAEPVLADPAAPEPRATDPAPSLTSSTGAESIGGAKPSLSAELPGTPAGP